MYELKSDVMKGTEQISHLPGLLWVTVPESDSMSCVEVG
jgi:hypothetical protein